MVSSSVATTTTLSPDLWHSHLGHASLSRLRLLASQGHLGSVSDGNQGGPSLKDPLQVPDWPITRSRVKKIKEAMQGLVQFTWDEASKSPTIKVGLTEGEQILIHLIQAVKDMT